MTNAQILTMPKSILRLPDNLRMTVRVDGPFESIVYGLRADAAPAVTAGMKRVGDGVQMRKGGTKAGGGCQDVLREDWREGSSGRSGVSR